MTTRPISKFSRIATRSSSIPPPIVTTAPKRFVHEARIQHAIRMPVMSPFLTECTISRWNKKEGEAFYPGDVLLQIESDIAMIDVPAEDAGIIARILIPDGTANVPFQQVIALVARDSQEYARIRAQSPLQSPPSLSPISPRRSSSPIPFDRPLSPTSPSASSSPRTPVTRQLPFRYQSHMTTSPSPPVYNNSAGAVRGMVTNHVRSTSLTGVGAHPSASSTPSSNSRPFAPSPRRNTISFSTAANGHVGDDPAVRTPKSRLQSRFASEVSVVFHYCLTPSPFPYNVSVTSETDLVSLFTSLFKQLDGASIRRIIVNNLSRNSPVEKSPHEYFEGIL